MMKKLPADFELDRYGLHCRLVREEDAEFIVKLRSNPDIGKYIHLSSGSVVEQKKWIRDYKGREKEGKDYYFIFEFQSRPVGVYRIVEVNDDGTYMCGSLVFGLSAYKMASVAAFMIVHEIAFENLELSKEVDYMGTHAENKSVLMCKKMFGFEDTGIRVEEGLGEFVTATLIKENFYSHKTKIEHFLLK